MKLVIALITKDRVEKTEETLKSFQKQNGWGALSPFDVHMLHGDDGSLTSTNTQLAHEFGFKTVISNDLSEQLGAHAMRRAMIKKAKEYEATHFLIWENDWRSVRPIPWAAIVEAFSRDDVYAFRLYHEHKQKDKTRPTGVEHAGRKHLGKAAADAGWTDIAFAGEQCEIGEIHFGAPPCVFRMEELEWLHEGTTSDSKSMRKSGQIPKKTVRVKENVVWHIGYERTPGFKK